MGFYADHCFYLPAFVGWFVFSALLSSYNKVVFGEKHLAFPCPLLLTSIHFFVQWAFSWTLSSLCPRTFGGDDVKAMSWRVFLGISLPCGLVTSSDVGLSNMALVRISITFYTMIKASSPIFVLASAFAFGIEKVTISLVVVVAIIAAGEFLTVIGEVEFDAIGFFLCLAASVMSGVRWTLVQFKLQNLDPPLKSTIATMRVLSPSMFFSMLLVSFALERPWHALGPESGGKDYFATPMDSLTTISMGLIGAALAIAMIMFEFYLIIRSNAIVLMIGGVLKEMNTILIGVVWFGDPLNVINVSGFFVVFLGVILYKITFHLNKLESKAKGESQKANAQYRPISDDVGASSDGTTNVLQKEEVLASNDFEDETFDMESDSLEMRENWDESIHRLRSELEEDDFVDQKGNNPGIL